MLCPKCGTANPDSSEQCFNCGQLLSESPGAFRDDRPNVPQWGDDLVPDWLSALQVNLPEELRDPALEEKFHRRPVVDLQPDETPVRDRRDRQGKTIVAGEVPSELEMKSDEWFKTVLSSMREDFVAPTDSDETTASAESLQLEHGAWPEVGSQPEGTSLAGPEEFWASISSAETASQEDWLRGLRAEMQETGSESGRTEPPEDASRGMPDWLREMPFSVEPMTLEAASATPGPAQVERPTPADEEAGAPMWLKGMEGEPADQVSVGEGGGISPPSGAEETSIMPDWLRDFSAPPGEAPEEPAAEASMPEWLDMYQQEQEQPPAETPVPAAEPSVPDWLSSYAVEPSEPTPSEQEPEPGDYVEAATPASLYAELVSPPSAKPPAGDEENVPEWLRDSLQEAFDEVPSSLLGKDRDLQARDAGTAATIPLTPVKPGEAPAETPDMPEWLRQLRAQEEIEETQPPSWLAEAELGAEAGLPEEELPAIQEETPAWLWGVAPAEEDKAAVETEAPPQWEETPDWLSDLSAVPEELSKQVLEIDEREVPAWLKQLGGDVTADEGPELTDLAATQAIHEGSAARPPASEQPTRQGLVPPKPPPGKREIATEAMPSVSEPEARARRDAEGPRTPQLKQGDILAGLGAALTPPVSHALLKPEQPVSTEALFEGSERAGVFQEIVSQPLIAGELPQKKRKRRRFWPALGRCVLYFLIIAVVAITLYWQGAQDIGFFSEYNMPISPRTQQVYAQINAVPERSPVLLIADYEPSLAEELNAQARTLLHSLIQRKLKVLIVSTTFTGPQVMQNMWDDLADREAASYRYGEDYINLGYLPAQEMSLLLFGQNPLSAVRVDFKNLRDLKEYPLASTLERVPQESLGKAIPLIVYLSGSEESLRLWIEQVIARQSDVRMIAGVSAGLEPYTYPYVAAGQLAGVLAGLTGAAEYEALTQAPGRAVRSIDSQAGVHLVIVGLIILGNIVYVLGRMFGRR